MGRRMTMDKLKQFFVDNWRSKLASLLIAISVWHLIKYHLDSGERPFPVPGEGTISPAKPVLNDTILGPLTPVPAPAPIPIPVPGGGVKG